MASSSWTRTASGASTARGKARVVAAADAFPAPPRSLSGIAVDEMGSALRHRRRRRQGRRSSHLPRGRLRRPSHARLRHQARPRPEVAARRGDGRHVVPPRPRRRRPANCCGSRSPTARPSRWPTASAPAAAWPGTVTAGSTSPTARAAACSSSRGPATSRCCSRPASSRPRDLPSTPPASRSWSPTRRPAP